VRRRLDDRVPGVAAMRLLRLDLVDEDHRVAGDHAGEGEHAQERHEAQEFVREEEGRDDPDEVQSADFASIDQLLRTGLDVVWTVSVLRHAEDRKHALESSCLSSLQRLGRNGQLSGCLAAGVSVAVEAVASLINVEDDKQRGERLTLFQERACLPVRLGGHRGRPLFTSAIENGTNSADRPPWAQSCHPLCVERWSAQGAKLSIVTALANVRFRGASPLKRTGRNPPVCDVPQQVVDGRFRPGNRS
jgi:hypothetical protein